MKPIHVAATIVRLFAICLVTFLINSFMFFVSAEEPYISIFSIALPISLLIVSLMLWNFPVSISRKITGIPSHSDEIELSFKGDEFLSICMFSLGIYFLYGLVGEAIYWFKYLNGLTVWGVPEELSLDQTASLWAFSFRLVFAFLLLAGNQLIVKIYNSLRHGG